MISLKIENLLLNNLILNNKEEIFNEGYTFKGRVLELIDNLILIDIKGHGTIQAKLESSIKMTVGDEVSFLVKSVDNDEIILKPLIKDKLSRAQLSNEGKQNNPISALLKNINIKETRLSIGLAESLMKYNAPITKQNLTEGIKTLEKLFQLYSLKDGEKVILLNSVNNIDKDSTLNKIETIQKNFIIDIDSKANLKINKQEFVQDNILEDDSLTEKIDIKSLLVIPKDEYNEGKDITQLVKEFLGNESDIDIEDEYIKIISFFLKNNIKPSLNNIRNLREFNKNPIEFVKDFKIIDEILNKHENNETNKIFSDNNEVTSPKNIILNKDEKFVELQKNIQNIGNTADSKLTEDLRNLNNKIDFLREMNKDLSFMFFPINHREKELDGILTLIKENRKNKNYNEKTNIYINVETHNLGNIKVSCQLISNFLSIKMNIKNEDLELFKSTEKQLVEKISLIGYSLDKIEFVTDNNIQIIDTIVSNPNPTYILDLKV